MNPRNNRTLRSSRARSNRTVPRPIDQMTQIQAKFTRLAELRRQIESNKSIYEEHDRLVEELLPMFIERNTDNTEFRVKREIQIGTRRYRFTPSFLKGDELVAKSWKSVASASGRIE
jgi:hypothetical protein